MVQSAVDGDVRWLYDQLNRSDCAETKRFYCLYASSSSSESVVRTDEDPLGLCKQPHLTLSDWLCAARLIALDERTLWECVGRDFLSVLRNVIDPWNEQQAIKVVHHGLQEREARLASRGNEPATEGQTAELVVELAVYAAAHMKPPRLPTIARSSAEEEETNNVRCASVSAMTSPAVGVVPMETGNDYSEGCLVCQSAVAAFSDLLHVPRDALFFRDTVTSFSSLGRVIAGHPRWQSLLENEEALLVLCLLYERHVVRSDRSHWRLLLQSCPAGYPTVPAFWAWGDLSELEGVDILDDVVQKKEQLRVFEEQVTPLLPDLFDALGDDRPADCTLADFCAAFTTETILWARATFDSRAFKLNIDGSVVLSLVPLADMINHQNRSDVLVRKVLPSGGDFVMQVGAALTADTDVGREIWMSYGPLQNWELLQFYGFVLTDNVHDKLPFPLQLQHDPDDPWDVRRLRLIEQYALYSVQRCWIASSGLPSEALCALLRVQLAQAEEFETMEAEGPFAPLSTVTEAAVVDAIEQTTQCVLGLFTTTLEEDEETLRELSEVVDRGRPSSHDDGTTGAAHTDAKKENADDAHGSEEGAEEENDEEAEDDEPNGKLNRKLCLQLRIGLKQIAARVMAWCAASRPVM